MNLKDIAMSAATTALKLRSAKDFIEKILKELAVGKRVHVHSDRVQVGMESPSVDFVTSKAYAKTFPNSSATDGGRASSDKIYVNLQIDKIDSMTVEDIKSDLRHQGVIYQTLLHEFIHVLDFRAGKIGKSTQPVYRRDRVNPKYLSSGWEMEAYGHIFYDAFFDYIKNTTFVRGDWATTRIRLLNRNSRIKMFLLGEMPWFMKESDQLRRSILKRIYALWPFAVRHAIKHMQADIDKTKDPVKFREEMANDKELKTLLAKSNLQRAMADADTHKSQYVRTLLSSFIRGAQDAQQTNGGNYFWKAGAFEVSAINSTVENAYFDSKHSKVEISFDKPPSDDRTDIEYIIEQIKTPGSVINSKLVRALS